MVPFKKILILSCFTLLFSSCRKSTDANWDVDVTVPVVNSLLDIKNFVNDSLFEADNTGLLYISLNRQVVSLKLDSLLALPDTTIPPIALTNTLGFFTPTAYPGVPITGFQPSELTFDIPNGVALKRADIK